MAEVSQSTLSFLPPVQKTHIEYGDYDDIRATVKCLQDTQCEDVARVENSFKVRKGYLCTNGTGTGKTFVGLGTIYRFLMMGKSKILIVVPTDAKCSDWKSEAREYFGIDIHIAQGLENIGEGITVMTYANFYQNTKVINVWWDLIVYDESHYLVQNGQGKSTVYLEQHFKCSNVWSTARSKAVKILGYPPSRDDKNYEYRKKEYSEKYEAKVQQIHNKTRVLFLSATPFAYRKNLIYGDGTIFNDMRQCHPPEDVGYDYNKPDRYQEFMSKHFGYTMKVNKMTEPEAGVDMNLMEREFFEYHAELGCMGTRQLDVDKDYSRHFVKLESEEAKYLNEGLKFIADIKFKQKYPTLYKYKNNHFNYRYINQLLEISKAKYVHERIQQHLDLDRQVVLFHSFNHATVSSPFHFDARNMLSEQYMFDLYSLSHDIIRFREENPNLWNLDFSELLNPRDAIKKAFPNVMEFNGTVSKKKRKTHIHQFQDDDLSKFDIIMVQSAAGREGISLHDKTGHKQRVMIDLSLPIVPVEASQKEGRIYRSGVKSHAIYEYITLQYWFEENAFAVKVAERARTVENLAMGHLARDLETAFKEGYQNYTTKCPNIMQGLKGKGIDRSVLKVDDYDRAKAYYYMRSKNKGELKYFDYFATPEPLGYIIVRSLKLKPGNDFLEPSVGHGAIGRWADGMTENTFIEPVTELSSKAALNCTGKVINTKFEDHYIGNKAHHIAMNPPFGHAGKLAAEHLDKALKHGNRLGATLIAILPAGNSMEKRLDAILEDKAHERYVFSHRILLPDCVFKKESTSVLTQIVKFQTINLYGPNQPYTRETDLRYITDIKEFFDVIKDLEI